MKTKYWALLPIIIAIACNNNKPATTTTNNNPAKAIGGSISKSDMYGKWSFKSAIVKMNGPDGKMIMNDTMHGGANDYYIFKEDGSTITHIGQMQDSGHFKFISNDELVGDKESARDSGRIKILSLTSSECTMSIKQKKAGGSVDMMMFLTKK